MLESKPLGLGFKNPLKVLMLESKPLGLDSPKLKLWKECECLDERSIISIEVNSLSHPMLALIILIRTLMGLLKFLPTKRPPAQVWG